MKKKIKYVIKTRGQIIKQRLLLYTLILIILALMILLCFKTFKQVEALSNIEEEEPVIVTNEKMTIEKNKNNFDVSEIIKENTITSSKKTLNVDEVDLDYTTEYIENNELPTGTLQVKQEGTDGTQKMIVIKSYNGDEYVGEERIQGEIIAQATNKIVEIGTGEGINNYSPKKGDSIYATPDSVKVRKAASRKAEEICEMKKDEKATIVEVINNNWLKIQYSTNIGFADAACFTNINPFGTTETIFEEGVEYSKEELLASLSFDMDLTKPSGLTLSQFQKVLSGNPEDKQNVIASNAEYFYYAEKQYGINGIYLAS